MHAHHRPSILAVLIETSLALAGAFAASIMLGTLAMAATAMVVEEDGLGFLVGSSRKLSVSLTTGSAEQTAPIVDTVRLVEATFPGSDVTVLPEDDNHWSLTAWFDDHAPTGSLGVLSEGLGELGWEPTEPKLALQSSALSAMENPARLQTYVPALITVQAVCFMLVAWVLLRWRVRGSFWPRRGATSVVGWGVGAALAAFLVSTLLGGLLAVLGIEVEEQGWIRALMTDRAALLQLAPWLVLIGPISEEVFFRGYVFRRAYVDVGPGIAYATSAVMFGVIHAHPVGFPLYVGIGLVFCWVHRRTGTLWAPVIAHVVYNAMVLSIPLLVSPR